MDSTIHTDFGDGTLEVKAEINEVPVKDCQDWLQHVHDQVETSDLKKVFFVYQIFLIAMFGAAASRDIAMEYDLAYSSKTIFQDEPIFLKSVSTVPVLNHRFADLSNIEEVYNWMRSPLFSTIYESEYDKTTQTWRFYNKSDWNTVPREVARGNYVTGAVQVRQIRVKSGDCPISYQGGAPYKCYPYLDDNENTTIPWSWSNLGVSYVDSTDSDQFNGFVYRSQWSTQVYHSGGFVKTFDYTRMQNWPDEVNRLQTAKFLDQATRGLNIAFNLFNPASNRWVIHSFWIEFSPSGALYMTPETLELFLSTSDATLDSLIPWWVIAGFLLYWHIIKMIRTTWLWYKRRNMQQVLEHFEKQRFNCDHQQEDTFLSAVIRRIPSFWAVFEFVFLTLLVVLAILSAVNYTNLSAKDTDPFAMYTYYYNLEHVAGFDKTVQRLQGVVIFLALIKVLKFVQMDSHISIVATSLRYAILDIAAFMVFFGILFLAFACMAHIFFGPELYDYSTLGRSMVSQLSMLFGDINTQALQRVDSFWGPVYFNLYLILMAIVLVNFFIGILVESFSEEKRSLPASSRRKEISTYLKEALYQLYEGLVDMGRALGGLCSSSSDWKRVNKMDTLLGFFFKGKLSLSIPMAYLALEQKIHKAYELILQISLDLAIHNAKQYDKNSTVMISKKQFLEVIMVAMDPKMDEDDGSEEMKQSTEHAGRQRAGEAWSNLLEFHRQQARRHEDLDDIAEKDMIQETRTKVEVMESRIRAELQVIRASQRQLLSGLATIEKQALSKVVKQEHNSTSNYAEQAAEELQQALADETFEREHTYVTRNDLRQVMHDFMKMRTSWSPTEDMLKDIAVSGASRMIDETNGHTFPYQFSLRVERVKLRSASGLAMYTENVFCQLLIKPVEQDLVSSSRDSTQYIRRTSLIGKADSTKTQEGQWENVFNFSDDPFLIKLRTNVVRIELSVYHMVKGIRMQRICHGTFSDDKRGDVKIPLYSSQNRAQDRGSAQLHIRFSRSDTDDKGF